MQQFWRLRAASEPEYSPHFNHRPNPRRRHTRRLGAGSLAVGTFAGLGLMLGTGGVANASVDWLNIASPEALLIAFQNPASVPSGQVRLADTVGTMEVGALSLTAGGTLSVDLNGQTLIVTGAHGAVGEPGETGIDNDGELFVTNGTLSVSGGVGGTWGFPAGDETTRRTGAGGDAVHNNGRLVLATSTTTLTGGKGGDGSGIGGKAAAWGGATAWAAVGRDTMACDGHLGLALGFRSASAAFRSEPPGTCSSENYAWPDHATLHDGDGDGIPHDFYVFGVNDLNSATGFLETSVGWPSNGSATLTGWATTSAGEVIADGAAGADFVGKQFFAIWTSGSEGETQPEQSPAPSPPTANPTTVSTSAPLTTSAKPGSIETPARGTAPTASTSTPIPTNNVNNPVTFTSSQAPNPLPLPTGSSVDDTSASRFEVDTHNPTQGSDLVLTATGFKPGTVVDFWIHSSPVYVGSAIADVRGIAVLPVVLDPSLIGVHHVQSIGLGLLGEPRNLAQEITITAPPALAATGDRPAPLAFLALLLLAGGAALLLTEKRRGLTAAFRTRRGGGVAHR